MQIIYQRKRIQAGKDFILGLHIVSISEFNLNLTSLNALSALSNSTKKINSYICQMPPYLIIISIDSIRLRSVKFLRIRTVDLDIAIHQVY